MAGKTGKITYTEPLDYFPKELRDKFLKNEKKTSSTKKTTTKKKSK